MTAYFIASVVANVNAILSAIAAHPVTIYTVYQTQAVY